MGHIINPITHRLGFSRFWSSSWATLTQRNRYSYIAIENTIVTEYINKLLAELTYRIFSFGVLITELKIIRILNKLIFINYIKFNFLTRFITSVGNIALSVIRQRWFDQLKKNEKFSPTVISSSTSSANFINLKEKAGFKKKLKIIPQAKTCLSVLLPPSQLKKIQLGHSWFSASHTRKRVYLTKARRPLYININEPDKNTHVWKFGLKAISTGGSRSLLSIRKFNSLMTVRFAVLVRETLFNLMSRFWILPIQIFLNSVLTKFTRGRLLKNSVKVIFVVLGFNTISASFLTNYISIKLLQNFPLTQVINNIFRQVQRLMRSGQILGFKVSCNGRFARRGRATHLWRIRGRLPRSTTHLNIDYSISLPVLVNSICAIKVWLTKPNQSPKLFII